jgi:eukaryotic-like serine/threonine-protein kinase
VIAPGRVIAGKYKVVSRIGEGAMGVVYGGVHTQIDRRVAIKVMHPSIAQDFEAVARFEREAQAVTRIGSQHVVDVLELGALENGERYIVMEHLEGESLGTRLKREGFLPHVEVVHIGIQTLDGLAKVHEAGIIHRDLKPGNIFLSSRRGSVFVKILDFGVCKMLQSSPDAEALTTIGQLLGTPAYMAPEAMQLGPANVDARADLYSVGMILRRSLAGRLPYEADSVVEMLVRLREEKPLPLASVSPDVDVQLAGIVDRAIARDPAARFGSAVEFKRALLDWTLARASTGVAHASTPRVETEEPTGRLLNAEVLVDFESDDDDEATLPIRISPLKNGKS